MRIYKVEEKLVQDGIAVTSARDIRILSDVKDDGIHTYGLSPAEIMGNALGSCLLINAQRISKKMRINFSHLSAELQIYWQKDPPKVSKIEYVLYIKTEASDDQLEKFFHYTLKYSTAYNTLKDSVELIGNIKRINEGIL